mgnify:CR=1 FL=1
MIIEEGFPFAELRSILASAANAAQAAGVSIVTGDTKVVPRGAVDGLFINTAGLGELIFPMPGPSGLTVGDELLVSGPLGRHGMAVLAARESLPFDPPLESDSASLFPAVEALRLAGVPVKTLRDATRGGGAAVLHEWADACNFSLAVEDSAVPVTCASPAPSSPPRLDRLHVPCHGTPVTPVPPGTANAALNALHSVPVSAGAARIGEVIPREIAPVVVRRALKRLVPLDEPLGAPLPRIC